jgi:hypothetical protein
MKKPAVVISFATLFMVFYNLSPYIGIPDEAIIAMFILSPIILIYMVYIILRFGKPSKYTFEEKFYDDLDYSREKD